MGGYVPWQRARLLSGVVGVLLIGAALVSRLGTNNSTAAVSSTLHGNVGPGFDISLTFDDGSPVTALPAGTYTVQVVDQAADHNFHLVGPGVDQETSVDAVESARWTVTFGNNAAYVFQCDPHASEMNGRFTVGSPPPDVAPTTSGGKSAARPAASSDPLVGRLQASVSGGGKLALVVNGKPVTKLKQGSYAIVVKDASPKYDFTVRQVAGPEGTALTSVAFVGTRTVTLDLGAGQWKYYSSRREAASSVFFRVTKA
jgi:plastocyanin